MTRGRRELSQTLYAIGIVTGFTGIAFLMVFGGLGGSAAGALIGGTIMLLGLLTSAVGYWIDRRSLKGFWQSF